MHKVFRYPKVSGTFKGGPRRFSHCETQFFRRKNVIPPNMHKVFRYPKFPETFKVCPRKFSALWDIKLSTENRDMPRPIHKLFSIPETFWKTKGFLYKNFRFGPVGQKIWTKLWCPTPHMHDNFRKKSFSETPNCSPMKNFGTVRRKIFGGKLW